MLRKWRVYCLFQIGTKYFCKRPKMYWYKNLLLVTVGKYFGVGYNFPIVSCPSSDIRWYLKYNFTTNWHSPPTSNYRETKKYFFINRQGIPFMKVGDKCWNIMKHSSLQVKEDTNIDVRTNYYRRFNFQFTFDIKNTQNK